MYDKLFPSPFLQKINDSLNSYNPKEKNINLPRVRERTKSHLENNLNRTFL